MRLGNCATLSLHTRENGVENCDKVYFNGMGKSMGKFEKNNLKQRYAARGENFCFTVEQLRSKFKKCVSEC